MKGLLHHAPTDDDISNILKEFTVDFLLKGYGCLVQELHSKLLSESDLVCIRRFAIVSLPNNNKCNYAIDYIFVTCSTRKSTHRISFGSSPTF